MDWHGRGRRWERGIRHGTHGGSKHLTQPSHSLFASYSTCFGPVSQPCDVIAFATFYLLPSTCSPSFYPCQFSSPHTSLDEPTSTCSPRPSSHAGGNLIALCLRSYCPLAEGTALSASSQLADARLAQRQRSGEAAPGAFAPAGVEARSPADRRRSTCGPQPRRLLGQRPYRTWGAVVGSMAVKGCPWDPGWGLRHFCFDERRWIWDRGGSDVALNPTLVPFLTTCSPSLPVPNCGITLARRGAVGDAVTGGGAAACRSGGRRYPDRAHGRLRMPQCPRGACRHGSSGYDREDSWDATAAGILAIFALLAFSMCAGGMRRPARGADGGAGVAATEEAMGPSTDSGVAKRRRTPRVGADGGRGRPDRRRIDTPSSERCGRGRCTAWESRRVGRSRHRSPRPRCARARDRARRGHLVVAAATT